jgi:hypothetical protein
MGDRLRAVHCPFDIVHKTGGRSTSGVGHADGTGYGLDVFYEWMGQVPEWVGVASRNLCIQTPYGV